MHLKNLTLKGFKSFADIASIDLEPGVTVVVGPNGSGKSNVVDAIAWVLGAQAPKSVRSQKMDDVIFAGTAKRPALGRAFSLAYLHLQLCYERQISRVQCFVSAEVVVPWMGSVASARGAPAQRIKYRRQHN